MAVTTRTGTETPGLMPSSVYEALRSVARLANHSYWRVSVEGASVPAAGPVILAPVHRSFIDFFVVSEASRRKLFFMTKEEMWNSRMLGKFLDVAGAFPVRRQGADRLSLERAQSVLEHGEVLVLFPEGTRRSGPVVEDLQEGAAFLSARTGAPIVPVGIGGTSKSLPKGSKLPRPVRVHLVIGDAIQPPSREAGQRTPRSEVRELTSRLCSALQDVYDKALERV